MWIRRYQAADMAAAMKRIREDLGPDALILETRDIRRGGLARFLRPPRVEVLAAVEAQPPRPAAHAGGRYDSPHSAGGPRTVAPPEGVDGLAEELGDLRASVQRLERRYALEGEARTDARWEPLRNWLAEQRVEASFRDELCDKAVQAGRATGQPGAGWDALGATLENCLPITGPLAIPGSGPAVLSLVGPTGVGKTTTLAKLAAFAVKGGYRLTLVTIDTFRVAAVTQLGTYADLMGVPMQVAYSPEELRDQVASHRDKDLILIDTPGRSPLNHEQIRELHPFLDAVPSCEVHLVVAAPTDYYDMRQAVDAFGALSPSALVVTKLDETARCGAALSLVRSTNLPVSYLTNGQQVPEDIMLATAADLARLLVGTATSRGGDEAAAAREGTRSSARVSGLRPAANGRSKRPGKRAIEVAV